MNITTDSNSRSILIDIDGCNHPGQDPLNCEAHDYAHEAGFVCADCHRQFFWVPGCGEQP